MLFLYEHTHIERFSNLYLRTFKTTKLKIKKCGNEIDFSLHNPYIFPRTPFPSFPFPKNLFLFPINLVLFPINLFPFPISPLPPFSSSSPISLHYSAAPHPSPVPLIVLLLPPIPLVRQLPTPQLLYSVAPHTHLMDLLHHSGLKARMSSATLSPGAHIFRST